MPPVPDRPADRAPAGVLRARLSRARPVPRFHVPSGAQHIAGVVERSTGSLSSAVALAVAAAERTLAGAAPISRSNAADAAPSPVTSIDRVLLTFFVGLGLALLFSARGIVHAGTGMEPGLKRDVTLAIGQPLLAVTDFVHLTWPWDRAEIALGRKMDEGSSSLLAAAPTGTPVTAAAQPAVAAKPTPIPTPTPKSLRAATAAHPLRLLVTGDSLTEFMGPALVNAATQMGPVKAWSDTHYGTGIVRPDFVDWAALARQQMQQYRPEAVVVFIGGNDFQNMTMPDGRIIQAASPEWTREYARRVAICMRLWTSGSGRRVYWLSMPPARDSAWSVANHQINVAIQQAAREVPGAQYLNVLGPVTDHGRYADFVEVNGTQTAVRTPDGIHFTNDGSDIVAHEVLAVLQRQWHLGIKQQPTAPRSKPPR